MATVEKRPLTAEEVDDARRLKAAWEGYQGDHKGASQTWLASQTKLGNQSLIGQYLNGVIQLNLNALLAICSVIGCDPKTISPRLTRNMPAQQGDGIEGQVSPQMASEIGEVVLRYTWASPQEREYVLGVLRDSTSLPVGRTASSPNKT